MKNIFFCLKNTYLLEKFEKSLIPNLDINYCDVFLCIFIFLHLNEKVNNWYNSQTRCLTRKIFEELFFREATKFVQCEKYKNLALLSNL